MMADARRACLKDVQPGAGCHPGLWLQKCLSTQDREIKEARNLHVADTAAIGEPTIYGKVFDRWELALRQLGALVATAHADGRLAIGHGADSALETSLAIHHTYGVPYLPASSLKGLAARFARRRLVAEEWHAGERAYRTMFGDTDEAGFVQFCDGMYVPGSGHKGQALHPDVMTVHHSNYYQGGEQAPADWDEPNPVPFITATGEFLIALVGPTEWCQAALEILKPALQEDGIGAKTSSGYGRMTIIEKPAIQLGADAVALLRRIDQLAPHRIKPEIGALIDRWARIEPSSEDRRIIQHAMLEKVHQYLKERDYQEKLWYKRLNKG